MRVLKFFLFLPIFLFAQTTDLFFSEYIEGTSFNKAIEIFNPTDQTVDLTLYMMRGSSNNATGWENDYTFPAGAEIEPFDVYVIADDGADQAILDAADWITSGFETGYNGNDARGLFLINGDVLLDLLGDPNNPDALDYSVAGISSGMTEHTLIRKSTVSKGNTDWSSSSGTNATDSEWIVRDQNDFSDLGKHTFEGGNPVISGSGTGSAVVSPASVDAGETVNLEFTFSTTDTFELSQIKILIPSDWQWGGSSQLSNTAFAAATSTIINDTLIIDNTAVNDQDSGILEIQNITAPAQFSNSVFEVFTATAGNTAKKISGSPAVRVVSAVTIEDIQNNFNTFNGQVVTVKGVVSIGAGITTTSWTDAYMQDTTGRGINVYRSGEIVTGLDRGAEIKITGTVAEFSGTTEITDFTFETISTGNEVPAVEKLSISEASNTDLEGTMIETAGIIEEIFATGGGTNVTINDGIASVVIRIWDSSGLNLAAYSVGDTLGVRAIIDVFNSEAQLLVAYQEDLFSGQLESTADGTGTATVTPNEVETSSVNTLTFEITATAAEALDLLQIQIPSEWQWSGSAGDVTLGGGLAAAVSQTIANSVSISGADLTQSETGTIAISNLTAPATDTLSTFVVKTAMTGGTLTEIAVSPTVTTGSGTQVEITAIADIQNNYNTYSGKNVIIEGVVAIGSGKTTTTWTDTYVQDESERGINVYRAGEVVAQLARGNKVRITGTVEDFSGTTEITNFTLQVISTGNDVPGVNKITVSQSNNVDLEGTMIETAGIITDIFAVGGGTNVTIADATGSIVVRIWDSTGLNLSALALGDTLGVQAVIDTYNGSAQLLVAHQEDLFDGVLITPAEGSSTVAITPGAVEPSEETDLTFTFNATSPDTVNRISINVAADWQWSGTTADISLSGSLSSANLSISGSLINIENALLLPSNPGTLTINNITAPAVDTVSVFAIKTAGNTGTLTSIKTSPLVRVGIGTNISTISIADAREQGDGSTVTIKGTIVIGAGILRTDFTSAYIADETGAGLNVYDGGGIDPDIKRGNFVIMEGTLTEFNGVLEIENYSVTVIQQDAALPDPIELTTGQAGLVDYEGSFVKIKGVITGIVTAGAGINLYLDDGSGETTVRIWTTTGVDLSQYTEGDFVTVTGVHSVFNNAGQILLAYQEDIATIDQGEMPVSLDVPNKPFAPDKGEKLPLTYSSGGKQSHVTIRIYDLGGRLVTTLYDGEGISLEVTREWDGRNELGEQVPIGTYILHFEVVNDQTGKKTTKVAPVVVGTVLSR
ncbi:MAG: lamin tail domain-containing protein [Calditrichaeota bacterium]|nr:lamin tail domain-containing protein [Calditrichota bacterium]